MSKDSVINNLKATLAKNNIKPDLKKSIKEKLGVVENDKPVSKY